VVSGRPQNFASSRDLLSRKVRPKSTVLRDLATLRAMRLAVLSDIHSNLAALRAVAADIAAHAPDAVVVAGDFINRGPHPRGVRDFLGERGWPLLRGNHEEYVIAQCAPLPDGDALLHALWQPARWTAEQLDWDGDSLARLPLMLELHAPDGSPVHIWHGTAQRNNEGIFPNTPDDALPALTGHHETLPLFVCGHTHVSLVRRLGAMLVVNSGAAGLPFDGDPRACYALLDWNQGWRAEIRRIEYDREEALRTFDSEGFVRDGGPIASIVRREVETARPQLGSFIRHFADAVRADEITLDAAVAAYLYR
jgi:predicted phosphodiesterase